MELHIQNNQIENSKSISNNEMIKLDFQITKTPRLGNSKRQEQLYYQCLDNEQNLNKAFDILFEAILNTNTKKGNKL